MLFRVIIIFFTTLEIVLCRDAPIVTIPDQGQISGYFIKMFRTQTIVGYLGIPYAQAPVQEKRFMPPSGPLPEWEGIRDGSIVPMQCWSDIRKPSKSHDEMFTKILGIDQKPTDDSLFSEDCLYLNIYTPDEPPPKDGYAVIAWLHSGDFMVGNSSAFNPFQLVFKQGVIVVTIAFRLGFFGFFTTNDGESPGNYGLMDQSMALDWISKNIQLFNGNPKSVTLMGHGSGAVSAILHLTSGDWSNDKFQKLIVMSGTPLDTTFVRDPKIYKQSIKEVGEQFGCDRSTSKMLQCLRRLPDTHIMSNLPLLDWSPVIDINLSNNTMPFIPENPKDIFERNSLFPKVPIMIGFTDMEQTFDMSMRELFDGGLSNEMYAALISEVILKDIDELGLNNETTCGENLSTSPSNQPVLDAMMFTYKPYFTSDSSQLRKKFIDFLTEKTYVAPSFLIAKALSKSSEVFMYRFDSKPKTQMILDLLPNWSGVPHRFDQIFVWGMPYWVSLENQTQWSPEDKRLSDIIMTMWSNFAKFSNPTERGVYIRWNNFTEADPGVLIIDRSFNMSDTTTLNYQGVQFWNHYYMKVLDYTIQCCNVTNKGHASNFIQKPKMILVFTSFSVYVICEIFHLVLSRHWFNVH